MASCRHEHCCVPLCSNDSRYDPEKLLSFHAFQKDEKIRRQWIHAIRRDTGPNFKINEWTKVCSAHFKPSNLRKSLAGKRLLVKAAVPEVFPLSDEKKSRKPPKDRCSGANVNEESECHEETPMEVATTSTPHPDHDYERPPEMSLEDQLTAAMEHIERLEIENRHLRSMSFTINRFTTDPDMMAFYTGFHSYEIFCATFKALEPTASTLFTWSQFQRQKSGTAINTRNIMKHESLCTVDQFFLFLCRCKCGLFEKDLAVRFNISVSTVSRIIITWANYLYHVLGALPVWPSRARVDEFMPECFKESYSNTRVILDCTELKCQTPSSLYVNSQLYSHYKSHTTFKGLIGITPSGAVSFVSELYSGGISDVDITARSGIMDLLEKDDDVMADKGFTIQNLLSTKGATLNIPPFLTDKRSQFTKEEVLQTQGVARVRIHVERAIRRVKEFHIFDSVLPLSLAGTINQIWSVCALLTNFRGPLF